MSKLKALLKDVAVEWKTLGEVCEIIRGVRVTKKDLIENGKYPVVSGGTGYMGFVNEYNRDENSITIAQYGTAGFVKWQNEKFWANDVAFTIYPINEDILLKRFLYFFLINKQNYLYEISNKIAVPFSISKEKILQIKIPIPCPNNPEKSLEIQQEIVRVLDELTSLTNQLTTELETERQNRKKQFEFFREQLFRFDEDENNYVALGELSENLDSKRKPITSSQRKPGKIPYYGASGIVDYVEDYIFDGDYLLVSEDGANLLARSTPIAFSISGKNWVNNHAHILKFETKYERLFVEYYLNSIDLAPYITGAAQPKLNKKNLNSIKIPNPPLAEQKRIVKLLDQFDATHTAIEEEITKEIKLRTQQYEYYREKLLTFPKN